MPGGRGWVLSIGVNDYGAQLALPNLHCAVADACAIYRALVCEYGFQGRLLAHRSDIAASSHAQLADASGGAGTREEIILSIDELRRVMRAEDVFVLFFAGHGIAHAPGYLAPYGAEAGGVASCLMYQSLFGQLGTLACRRQILIFDCCYARVAVRTAPFRSRVMADDARVVAFAATDDVHVTPDSLPGARRHSPFSGALHKFLVESTQPGASFAPEQLDAYLRQELQHTILPGNHQPLTPVFRAEVPEVRPGRSPLIIQRPQLLIDVQNPTHGSSECGTPRGSVGCYRCEVGAALEVQLRAEKLPAQQSRLSWRVISHLAEQKFRPAESRGVGDGRWLLRFQYAGHYAFDACAQDETTEEEAICTFTVEVVLARRAIAIDAEPLPVCKRGEAYEARIIARDGAGRCDWRISGTLPPQIDAIPGDDGVLKLSGTAPAPHNAGAADCVDGQPIAYALHLEVRDAAGNSCSATKRLLVVSERDYCFIPKGKFTVGYSPTEQRNAAIRRMLEDHLRRRILQEYVGDPLIQRAVSHHGVNAGQHILAEVAEANPGSEVTLPGAFYIRKYPVTNVEWREFVHATGHSTVPRHWGVPPKYFDAADATLPVVNISYEDICCYLRWKGTRLPTAWEWERAARGTDGRLFPWGDDFDATRCNVWDSWQRADSDVALCGRLLPVDAHDRTYASSSTIRDIVGNAAEWVNRRVFSPAQRRLFNVFRGGSFLDSCAYALTFRDSAEAGIAFGAREEDHAVGQTAFAWLGFRDVVDLDHDPCDAQTLIDIPERHSTDAQASPVASFAMSRYAVSNLEYLEFVEAAEWSVPTHWKRSEGLPFALAARHLPVVNVSFHDALAFCLWKSRLSGGVIRLPTRRQWLAAALGVTGDDFPWGPHFDPQRCNLLYSGWGKRLPVFWLDDGRSREGVFNLIGNVWEWCSSPDPTASLHVMGGCWSDEVSQLKQSGYTARVSRADARRMKRDDIGFRYVENYPNTSRTRANEPAASR